MARQRSLLSYEDTRRKWMGITGNRKVLDLIKGLFGLVEKTDAGG
ncbi:hypothetical protein [Parapedobacter tibetensis]|nr:hypothetical protein [Parapedobacter tibetensis]